MRNKTILASAAVLLAAAAGVVMMRNHRGATPAAALRANALEQAPLLSDDEIMRALRASGVPIADLSVRSAGGIYILRGTGDPADALRAVNVIKGLGVTRVANLVTATKKWPDEQIRRDAERELASRSALEGTKLSVTCEEGVITVTGTVTHELQKDLARSTLSSIHGAREVRIQLAKL